MLSRISLILCCIVALVSGQAAADVIMRIEMKPGSNPVESFDIRLFEETTPLTVTNFLNYANDTTANGGNYTDLFAHRHQTDFVMQVGAFSYNSLTGNGAFEYDSVNDLYPGGLQPITTDDPVPSEALLQNRRGTIAMALLFGDPDSGTSQWFINLVDNVFLDTQGFTVFAEVLGDGMTTVDAILDTTPPYSKADIVSSLAQLPLFMYTDGDTIDESKLLALPSFTELMNITGELDFGAVVVGQSPQLTATVTNTGASAVTLGAVGADDALSAPFSLSSENCSSAILNSSDSCTLDINYSPTVIGDPLVDEETDTINIDLGNLGTPSYSYTLTVKGVGVAVLIAELVPSLSSIEFGAVALPDPGDTLQQIVLDLDNVGSANITVTSVSLTGPDSAEFDITEDCISSSPFSPSNSCSVTVELDPTTLGDKTADLVIESNDPDSPFIIPVTATVEPKTIDLAPSKSVVDFGVVRLPDAGDAPEQVLLSLDNVGNFEINVTSVSLTGLDVAEFSLQEDCITNSPILPAISCSVLIDLSALSLGDKTANLVIESDDPDSPFILPITATVSIDTDGIPDSVEDAVSNQGDGNNDGIADSIQSNVTSLALESGVELTLLTENFIDLTSVEIIPASALAAPPSGVTFADGGIRFGLRVGANPSADLGIVLPSGYIVDALYVYGPTVDDPTPQWYRFDFDIAANSGLFDFGTVVFTSPSGSTLQRQMSLARFLDGDRGDNDLLADGDITFEGALVITQVSDSSSMDPALMLLVLATLFGLRNANTIRATMS